MASGELNVDPDQIQRSGAQISSAAEQMQGHISAFQRELAGYGQPWGHDMVGSLIGGCYQAISGAAMKSFTGNTRVLSVHGQRVQAMASVYRDTEQVNTQQVNRIRETLG
jgi:hypothetical protein